MQLKIKREMIHRFDVSIRKLVSERLPPNQTVQILCKSCFCRTDPLSLRRVRVMMTMTVMILFHLSASGSHPSRAYHLFAASALSVGSGKMILKFHSMFWQVSLISIHVIEVAEGKSGHFPRGGKGASVSIIGLLFCSGDHDEGRGTEWPAVNGDVAICLFRFFSSAVFFALLLHCLIAF